MTTTELHVLKYTDEYRRAIGDAVEGIVAAQILKLEASVTRNDT